MQLQFQCQHRRCNVLMCNSGITRCAISRKESWLKHAHAFLLLDTKKAKNAKFSFSMTNLWEKPVWCNIQHLLWCKHYWIHGSLLNHQSQSFLINQSNRAGPAMVVLCTPLQNHPNHSRTTYNFQIERIIKSIFFHMTTTMRQMFANKEWRLTKALLM